MAGIYTKRYFHIVLGSTNKAVIEKFAHDFKEKFESHVRQLPTSVEQTYTDEGKTVIVITALSMSESLGTKSVLRRMKDDANYQIADINTFTVK